MVLAIGSVQAGHLSLSLSGLWKLQDMITMYNYISGLEPTAACSSIPDPTPIQLCSLQEHDSSDTTRT